MTIAMPVDYGVPLAMKVSASASSSDVESLFSPTGTSLSSPASTPLPDDDNLLFKALSSTTPVPSAALATSTSTSTTTVSQRQQLLQRLLAQMDPEAVREVEQAAQALRLKTYNVPPTVTCLERARVSTEYGQAFLYRYKSSDDETKEHMAWVYRGAPRSASLGMSLADSNETEDQHTIRGHYTGTLLDPSNSANAHTSDRIDTQRGLAPLVRIHSECFTGDIMGSSRCDCGEQLKEAKRIIGQQGGVLIYLRQEGRGIGLGEKMKAYNLQDLGADTVTANQMLGHPSDGRTFGLATAILQDLGQHDIRLLTNNPDKIESVEGPHRAIRVVERVPMIPLAWQNKPDGIYSKELDRYLHTKRTRMGHLLE